MLRSILPSSHKRIPSNSQFEIIDMDKENLPGVLPSIQSSTTTSLADILARKQNNQSHEELDDAKVEKASLNTAFDRLLTDLQIPNSIRPKLNGMDATVKTAMLRSSRNIPKAADVVISTQSRRVLRKTKSSEGLESPRRPTTKTDAETTTGKSFKERVTTMSSASHPKVEASGILKSASEGKQKPGHGRGKSLTIPKSKSSVNLRASESAHDPKSKELKMLKDMSAEGFCDILQETSSVELNIEIVKKLRLMLRNESTSWTEDFMKTGGYSALLTRLNELLEIEWREEQHDDMLLYEMLRCLKALSTSEIGRFALRSQCPRPFVQLVSLLYSDKKPGDVSSRQVIAELLLVIFDLYPPMDSLLQKKLPEPHRTTFSLIRSILLTRRPPTAEALVLPDPVSPHDFIASIHQPRIYKTYLQELSDVCRDYFWIFCHPQNTIWILDHVDEGKVERPRAPGGMTGGVEYEAMGYLATHFRLLNALCVACSVTQEAVGSELSMQRFHKDLFASGLERILLTTRKASTTYYPTLHLEVARYVDHARRANFDLPWTLTRVIGSPPSAIRKSGRQTPGGGSPASRPRSTVPMLPSPRKVDPIKLV